MRGIPCRQEVCSTCQSEPFGIQQTGEIQYQEPNSNSIPSTLWQTLYLKVPEVQPPFFPGRQRQVPTTWTRSPGFTLSTKSSSRMTSTERGSWPAGAFSGISWIVMVWWSLQTERPYSVSRGLFSSSYRKAHRKQCYFSLVLKMPYSSGMRNIIQS